MEKMNLYPFQEEAVEAIGKEFAAGRHRTLLVLPTGTGKTITFSEHLRRQMEKGGRGLILAHREELLTQAAQKLKAFAGLDAAVEKAESSALGSMAPVTVASVQSLCREARLMKYAPDYYTDVVVDEAHHSLSPTYRTILDHFEEARILGVTATPDRGDRKALSEVFESIAYEYPMKRAIDEGYLVKIRAKMLPVKIDLKKVSSIGGDYSADELGDALDPYLESIAARMAEECRDRKTVVFLPLIDTAKKFCSLLNRAGLTAAEVNGRSEDREEILRDFAEGRYQVLCNAMLLTEGWDCPSIDCVVVLRPTKIRSLYQQMVGRGTRLYPGKEDLLILDFLYLTEKHDLCSPASLFGEAEEICQETEKLLSDGEEWDLSEAGEKAKRNVLAEREASLAEKLLQGMAKKAKTVDPIAFALSIEAEDLALYQPVFDWEFDSPTPKQLEYLGKCGIAASAVTSKGYASLLIDKLIRRKQLGMSTPRQIRCLEKYGYQHVGTWSFERASREIDRLAEQFGWKG